MNGISPHKAKLLEAHRIRWEFGFNDPTMIGWVTVLGYTGAALLAWNAASAARRAGDRFDNGFWLTACVIMALLAVNKQLDLHILVTDLGRFWAVQNGLYQQRRTIQTAFVAAALLMVVAGGLALWRATRGRDASLRLALAGLAVCCGYSLIRAASFHHTDVLMRTTVFGVRWNWAIEVAGVALTAWAAWRYRAPNP